MSLSDEQEQQLVSDVKDIKDALVGTLEKKGLITRVCINSTNIKRVLGWGGFLFGVLAIGTIKSVFFK